MTISFTKIIWAGYECILVTESGDWRKPLLLLDARDIDELIKEWKTKK